jgi:amidase
MPFAPTLDTVGVFARDPELVKRVATVLLAADPRVAVSFAPATIHLVREAFELADADVRRAMEQPIDSLRELVGSERVRETSLAQLCADDRAADLTTWLTIYRVLQGTEFESCLGGWIADSRPALGPAMLAGIEFVKKLDRTRVGESIGLREHYLAGLNAALAGGDLLCLPTAPAVAPVKGSMSYDRSGDYYWRTLAINAIAGAARLPQISMPLAKVGDAPIGLSLIAGHRRDLQVLEAGRWIGAETGSI